MSRCYDLGTLQLHQCLAPSSECGMTLDTMHDAHSVLCFEHHGMDSRVRPLMDVAPTLSARNTASPGVSGNNPLVLHRSTFALDKQGGKGNASFAFETMPTICSDSHGTPHAIAEIRRRP